MNGTTCDSHYHHHIHRVGALYIHCHDLLQLMQSLLTAALLMPQQHANVPASGSDKRVSVAAAAAAAAEDTAAFHRRRVVSR